ncbi:MAG TPA: hypothetical protein VJJ75_03455 [Candidatus Nanoarchaeia archaeon]|nr:hypothetical protein [Candidatus Nanoarchaeia archaeon]
MAKENIQRQDIIKEVKFTIAEDAFEGPFRCCNQLTKKTRKQAHYKGLSFSYEVWRCSKCGEDYLDTQQAKKLEGFWTAQKAFDTFLVEIREK